MTKRGNGEVARLLAEAAQAAGPGPCVLLSRKSRPNYLFRGVNMRASRAVWILANGDPGDLQVLHTCGRGIEGCIRLGHLYLGTPADNMRDREADGSTYRGERHWSARLTVPDVRRIRELCAEGLTYQVIADRYGVSAETVGQIARGQTWKHVPALQPASNT